MIELTDKELALGKRLAHVDKSVRDQATASIRKVLSQSEDITYEEMLRHWKALFYCFWLADRPLVQQELAWDLANLILVCTDSNSVAFVRAFWETMCREWFDVDKHRVDKYLLLARRMVSFAFKSMQQSGWDEQLVGDYLAVYREIPIDSSDPKVPNSIRTHMGDVYVDELVRLASDIINDSDDAQAETGAIPVALLLEPFMRFIGTTSIRHLPALIQESVFESIVVRIAEAEERNMAQNSSGDSATSSDAHDNQIADESLEKVQFLLDSIPELKKQLLAVSGEAELRASGRKRLHLIYQAFCDTFPDEETDIALSKRITISEPIGAQERKVAEKHKRKKANKKRELKERRKQNTDLGRNIISPSAVDFDVNALASEATAEDRRNYEADIVKIREMEKRAGAIIGLDDSTKPASKKAKRKEKQQQQQQQQQKSQESNQDDIPQLIPIAATKPASEPTPVDSNGSAWIVRDKRAGAKKSSGSKLAREIANMSLLAESEKTIVVRDRAPTASIDTPVSTRSKHDLRTTPKNKQAASSDRQSSGKKRLGWALERNSVKRFLKTVPMLPSPEPVAAAAQAAQLKSVLRKESAYGDVPQDAQPLLKPAQTTPTKKKRRVSVNGHPSTPVGGRAAQRKRK